MWQQTKDIYNDTIMIGEDPELKRRVWLKKWFFSFLDFYIGICPSTFNRVVPQVEALPY